MRVALDHTSDIEISDWETARGMLADDLRRLQTTINRTWDVAHNVDGTQRSSTFGTILGQAVGTLGEQPTGLTIDDDGVLYFVTDYGHLVRWNGASGIWQFAPGDVGNGFFRDYAITPQEVGWILCDGSATTYLVVGGASLTTATFTTPNLSGSPAYKKSAAAYSGITAAGGASGGQSGDHTHTYSAVSAVESPFIDFNAAVGAIGAAGSGHVHTTAGTTAGTSNDHTHGVGSLDVAHLNVLPYFRR